jgi:hypothetical protein
MSTKIQIMEDDSSAYPGYGEMYRGSLKNNPEQEVGSLRDQTLECIDQFDSERFDEKGQYFMSPDESSQLFMYFTMAAAVIEELSIALLTKVLTDAERSTKSSTDFFERALIPCCTFKIKSPDGTIRPESGLHQ